METQYDIVIVGAGIVGCAVAFELSRYNLTVALVDGRSDVGAVTSKANSAILHTGFDAPPNSIESSLVQKGYKRFIEYSSSLGLPIEKIGGLLIAWDQEQLRSLPAIIEKGIMNGQQNLAAMATNNALNLGDFASAWKPAERYSPKWSADRAQSYLTKWHTLPASAMESAHE